MRHGSGSFGDGVGVEHGQGHLEWSVAGTEGRGFSGSDEGRGKAFRMVRQLPALGKRENHSARQL